MAKGDTTDAALSGFRVLDLSNGRGNHCGKLLADLGAEVIKVEPPEGSRERRRGPFKDDLPHPERSLYFAYYNSNKKSITLDLHTTDGQVLFKELVAKADVVIEAFKPGHLAALGLDYPNLCQVNPQIIMASVTPFGSWGPHQDYDGPDMVPMAMSGLMFISGEPGRPPTVPPGQQASDIASIQAATGVLVALYIRPTLGRGQYVEVSMQEALALEEHNISRYSFDGHIVQREGSQHGAAAPGRIFPTKDGFVHLFVGGGAQEGRWRAFLDWIGQPEVLSDPIWGDNVFRRANVDVINPVTADFTRQHPRDELFHQGQARHIPTAPVYTPAEFVEDQHTKARGYFVEVEHPELGRHRFPGAPYQLSASPWRWRRPAPRLGEHNLEVYGDLLGYSRHELVALRGAGVI